MKGIASRRVTIAIGVVGAVALLGLAGCGLRSGGNSAAADQVETVDMSWPEQALQSIGLNPADFAPAGMDVAEVAPEASASASPSAGKGGSGKKRHRLIRLAFGKNALHGEAVVQTDDGLKTVVAQRGVVTAVSATSITVRSTDGFTLTWAFGSPITVIENRAKVAPSAIAVGAEVGVAGSKSGTAVSARFIIEPGKK